MLLTPEPFLSLASITVTNVLPTRSAIAAWGAQVLDIYNLVSDELPPEDIVTDILGGEGEELMGGKHCTPSWTHDQSCL